MYPINLSTYRQMLKVLTSERKVIRYSEIERHEDFVLWRHDCDMSLNRALEIARIDADFGISSTFFIGPHSDFYNILEKKQTTIIREILALGHDVGLHLDASYHDNGEAPFDIEAAIQKDVSVLESVTNVRIEAFSFHNPTQEVLSFNDFKYAGIINCYSEKLYKTVAYSSDSNGYWRHQPIPDVLSDLSKTRLQILTHPEWWLEVDSLPRTRVLRCVYGRAIRLMSEYDEELMKHNDRQNLVPEHDGLNDYERACEIL